SPERSAPGSSRHAKTSRSMTDVQTLLAQIERAGTSLDERIALSHALSEIGDLRAIASERVPVLAGPFLMGEGARNRVHLSGYASDKYPVTVRAYREFVAQGGYRERAHWSEAGWAWRESQGVTVPRFWDDPAWANYTIDNHPVVGVSAFEAEAYAAFRGGRL